MSATIDERVVKMQFDNQEFEKNVETSINTLDKLKEALSFTKQKEQLTTLSDAVKTTSFDSMGDSLEVVKAKFSALEIAGIAALANLTNKAVDFGTNFIKSLTLDPVMTGFDKYAQITSSVQTILAATKEQGENIESVTAQVDKLKWFTDETSYSLVDMTSNIASFTSKGIKLADATTQMQGIATAAALAGANAQEASHAMTGFSKAIGEGSMKRQYWQWIQTAHMDTVQFKQSLIDAAVASGTLMKVQNGLYETLEGNEVSISNFEEAMKDAWITVDVMEDALSNYGAFSEELYKGSQLTGLTASELLEALSDYEAGTLDISKYTDGTRESAENMQSVMEVLSHSSLELGEKAFRAAQEAKTFKEAIDSVKDAVSSGWATTFELIFGNYEEARKLWTAVANAMYDLFAEAGNTRNEILGLWKELGGRTQLIEAFSNIFNAIVAPMDAAKEGFFSMFPGIEGTASALYELTEKFREFTETLTISDEWSNRIYNIFSAIATVLKGMYSTVKDVVYILSPAITIFTTLLDSLFRIGEALINSFSAFNDSSDSTKKFRDVVSSTHDVVKKLSDGIVGIIEKITDFTTAIIGTKLKDFFLLIKGGIDIIKSFEIRTNLLSNIISFLASVIKGAVGGISDLVSWIYDIGKAVASMPEFQKFLSRIKDFLKTIGEGAFEGIVNFFNKITGVISKIKEFNEETGLASKVLETLGIALIGPFYMAGMLVKSLLDFIKALSEMPEIQSFIKTIADAFSEFGVKAYEAVIFVAGAFQKIGAKIWSFGKSLAKVKFPAFVQSLKDGLESLKEFNERTGLLQKILDTIANVIVTPLYLIIRLTEAIATFVKNVYNMPEVQAIINRVATTLSDLGKKGYDSIIGFIEKLKSFKITDGINGVKDSISSLQDKVREFYDKLVEKYPIVGKIVDKLTEIIDHVKELAGLGVSTIGDNLTVPMVDTSEASENLSDGLTIVTQKVKEFLDAIDADKLIAIGFTVTMAGMLLAVWKLVNSFTKLSKATTETIGSVKEVFTTLKKTIASYTKKENSKWRDLAEAVAIVAGVLVVLALVDSKYHENLKNAGIILAILGASLLAFSFILSLISKNVKKADSWKEMLTLEAAMLSLGVSVVLLAAAVKILEGINFKQAQGSIGIIAELGLIMVALSLLMGKFVKNKSGLSGLLMMIGFAVIINQFAKAVKNLSEVDYEKISANIETLIIIFGGLSVLALAASNIGIFSAVGLFLLLAMLSKLGPELEKVFTSENFKNAFELIMDEIDKYMKTIIKIAELVAVMIIISGLFGKNIKSFGIGMILLGVALIAAAGAIKIIGMMNAREVNQGVDALKEVLKMFAILSLIMGIFKGGTHALKISAAIGILTLCLYPIAGAIFILGSMDARKVDQGTKAIAKVLACFALIVGAASLGNGKVSFLTILALVTGTILVVGELIALTFIPAEQIKSAVIGMVAVMASLSFLIKSVAGMGESKNNKGTFLYLLFVAGMVFLIAESLKMLAKQPWENLLAAAGAMSTVMMFLLIFMNKISQDNLLSDDGEKGTDKLAGFIAEIVVLLLGVAGSIALLANFGGSWDQMLTATASISIVLLALGKTLQLINEYEGPDWKEALNLMLEAVVMLAAIVGSIILLTQFGGSWDQMLADVAAIDLVLVGLLFTLNKLDQDNILEIGDSLRVFATVVALLLPIVGSLILLSQFGGSWDQMIAAAVAIDIVFAGIIFAVNKLDPDNILSALDSIKLFFSLVMILIPVVAAIAILSQYGGSWDQMIGASVSISILVLSLGGICALLSAVHVDVGTAAMAGLALGVFIDVLILVVGALGALLSLIPDEYFNELIKGMDRMIVIAGKIGDMFGAFIGGVLGGAAMKVMEDLGIGLEKFSEHASKFTDWISGVDHRAAEGAKSLAGALLYFAAGGIVDKVAGWLFGVKKNDIVSTFGTLGEGVAAFSNAVSGIDTKGVAAGAMVASLLFNMDIPESGGIIQKIFGEKNISLFSKATLGEEGFGGGIKGFADAVKGLNLEDVEGGIAIADALFNLSPPNEGGWLADIVGDNSFDLFGPKTLGEEGLGGGISAFSKAVKGLNLDDVDDGIAIADALFKLSPPNEGGILADVLGDNNFALFNGKTMGYDGLGGGIRDFCYATEGLDTEGAWKAVAIAQKIFALHPPNEGGWVGDILGNNNFEYFNYEKLGENGLGGGIKAFAEQTKDLTLKSVLASAMAATIFDNLSGIDMKNTGGFFTAIRDFFVGEDDTTSFKTRLEAIGAGVYGFAYEVSKLESSAVGKALICAQVVNALSDIDLEKVKKKLNGKAKETEWDTKGFISKFTTLAEGIKEFSNIVLEITDVDDVKKAAELLENITSLFNDMSLVDIDEAVAFTNKFSEIANAGIDKFCKKLANSTNLIHEAAVAFMKNAAKEIESNSSIVEEAMGKVGSGMSASYDTEVQKLPGIQNNAIANAINRAKSRDLLKDIEDAGTQVGSTLVSGTIGKSGLNINANGESTYLNDAISGSVEGICNELTNNEALKSITSAGQLDINTLYDSYGDTLTNPKNLSDMAKDISVPGKGFQQSFDQYINYNVGKEDMNNYYKGLYDGINDPANQQMIYNSMSTFAQGVPSIIDTEWDEHSPSKLAAEKAYNFMLGLANGFNEAGPIALAEMVSQTDSIYDALDASMSNVSSYVAENLDINPMITPYLDLTGVTNDANNLNSLFENGKELTINSRLGAMTDMFGEMNANSLYGNSQIVSALDSLHEDIQNLQNVVGNLQVVMDSGMLVGAIAPNMDERLGQMSMYKRRGM